MGVVFQDFQLLMDRSVEDNLAFVLKATGWKSESDMARRISQVLNAVGMERKAHKMPHQLSGGEQQRIAIARALLNDPEVIIADEPTGNLDDENASRLMELFVQMNKMFGTTIILATHSKKLMETYKFPVIKVENHRVSFTGKSDTPAKANDSEKKIWKGPKPQNYFAELSKQFDDIGNA